MGIISSVQPTHGKYLACQVDRSNTQLVEHCTATSDMNYAEPRIGPERIKGAYAWASLKAYVPPSCFPDSYNV
jgi:hypothetical protein